MFKFIKSLFTKKKRFTLDDLDLSKEVGVKFLFIKDGGYYQVYFWHPLYKELWPMPSRKVAIKSKCSLLDSGSWDWKHENTLTIEAWSSDKRDMQRRFETVNHLKIYFESLERQYNELHP